MAKDIDKLVVNMKVSFTMWEALKIRVSGIFKGVAEYKQMGDITQITYKDGTEMTFKEVVK